MSEIDSENFHNGVKQLQKQKLSQDILKYEQDGASNLVEVYKKLPLRIISGQGSYIKTDDGRSLLDFYCGHAVSSLGHSHPKLLDTIHKQVDRLLFYSNIASLEHQEEAATLLAQELPGHLKKIFFVNSGAEAIENALKVARLVTGRPYVISFRGGFHGRTLGALSVTGLERYRKTLGLEVPGHMIADLNRVDQLESMFKNYSIAGVIVEPIQSLAGLIEVPLHFLKTLREMTSYFGAALIFDELQTGGGRVGKAYCYASRMGLAPDMITLGKGIGGGIPVAVLAMGTSWAHRLGYGDLGTTFGGGPLACAALKATTEILLEDRLYEQVEERSSYIRQLMEPWFGKKGVQVRGMGLLLGLKTDWPATYLVQKLLSHGVLAGTCDDPNVVRIMPPLNLSMEDIDHFYRAWKAVFD